MSHCVENLFYVSNEANERFVPWHGLGTPVEEAPNSKEAIKLAGLDWEVKSLPIFDSFGKEIPNFKANTRMSDESVLGIVTNRYKLVQNEEAFAFTDALIGDEVKYETAGSLKNGKVVWMLAKLPETKVLDDDFEQFVCFTNAHDGTGAVRACMTNTRVVCNNTLNLALDTAKRSWSIKHVGNMDKKLDEAREVLGLAKRYTEELAKEAEQLAVKKISLASIDDIINSIFNVNADLDSARKINNINTIKTNFISCLNAPDLDNFKGTAWAAINAASDLVCHSMPNRLSKNYQENNWFRIMNGHSFVDEMYKRLAA